MFAIDMAACPQCAGPLTLIAAIEDPVVIAKILAHLGLPIRAPPRTSARIDEFFQTAKSHPELITLGLFISHSVTILAHMGW